MISKKTIPKKTAAKKPTPAKPPKKPVKQAAKKKTIKKATVMKGSKMFDKPTTIPATMQTSQLEKLLVAIDSKLGELVQIETYLAQKVVEQNAPAKPASLATCSGPDTNQTTSMDPISMQPVPSVAAAPAPAQQPSARPGAGTVGGMVWDYCDGLNKELNRAPTKDELLAAIKQYSPVFNGQPVNELTAATQYSKWRAANNLPRLPRGFGAAHASTPAPSAPTVGAPSAVMQPRAAVGPSMPALPVVLPPATPTTAVPSFNPPPVVPPAAPLPAPSIPPWLRAQG